MMSFAFLDMIFGGKGLEIGTYKPQNDIWSVRPKFTIFSNFDVKNSIKSS